MNYTYLYKKEFCSPEELAKLNEYDITISMFVQSDRVMTPAEKIPTKEMVWIVDKAESNNIFLTGKKLLLVETNDDWKKIKDFVSGLHPFGKRICIDSTGFTIPYLLFLLRTIYYCGVKKIDIIYSEPKKYIKDENTLFSEDLKEVAQIEGLAGGHISETENDFMIIAAGYDHSRIIDVANNKKPLQKILMFGFPSMSAEMFQENVFRAYKASEAVGNYSFLNMDNNIYAPANDPFVTAQYIKEYIDKKRHNPLTNIYLVPISSKPQALGMALYYINENCWKKGISILYPFSNKYHTNNTVGIARIWCYTFEFTS